MAHYKVIGTRKHSFSHESITDLQCTAFTSLGFENTLYTKQDVIELIESGHSTFYTEVGETQSWVKVINGPNGKYLRTQRNNKENDNLLELPDV